MQVVDVLRDGAAEDAELLELDERAVARVRARRGERLPELAHRAARVQALLPAPSRVGEEALVAVHRRLAVARPDAARAAERRDPLSTDRPAPVRAITWRERSETLRRAIEIVGC
jgi:hypothetical protein